jgi:hypothetical protein
MKSNNYSLEVFVNGKPVHEYEHNGNTFIEGRKSSEFEIEFRNHTAGRVLVVPSVDGISTLNGQNATAESPGYVVKGNDTLRIKGWTVDGGNAAQFVFKDKEGSYTRSINTTGAQAGVVGVIVYREKIEAAPVTVPYPVYIHTPVSPPPFAPYKPWISPMGPYNGPILTGGPYQPMGVLGLGHGVCNTMNINVSGACNNMVAPESLIAAQSNIDALGTTAKTAIAADAASYDTGASRRVQLNASGTATASLNSATASSTPFELGTGWGERVEMKTNQVTFNRGELDATIALYYDSRRNLEKRGIEVLRREPRVSNELPQAFAGIGCKPPPGWR